MNSLINYLNTSNVTEMNSVKNGSSGSGRGMFDSFKGEKIILGPNFTAEKVTSFSDMFLKSQAKEIIGLEYLNTSKATQMRSMFSKSQAISLNLSNFNTENVTEMSSMFEKSHANSLDLTSFKTEKVTNMRSMFGNNSWDSNVKGALATHIDLSSFDTRNVTDMTSMFTGAQVKILDLSSFDISNLDETKMEYMFEYIVATEAYAGTQAAVDKFNGYRTKLPYDLKIKIK